jgi:hypothetical protein
MSEALSSMPPDLWAGSQEGDSVAAVHPADLRNIGDYSVMPKLVIRANVQASVTACMRAFAVLVRMF